MFRNLHEYRYDVRALTSSGIRDRVIYVRKSLSKESTLDQKTNLVRVGIYSRANWLNAAQLVELVGPAGLEPATNGL